MNKRPLYSINRLLVTSLSAIVALLVVLIIIASYFTYSLNVEKVTMLQSQEISRQIIYNYENCITDVFTSITNVEEIIDQEDIQNGSEKVNENFATLLKYDNKIEDIYVYNTIGKCVASNKKSVIGTKINVLEKWFNNANDDLTTGFFTNFEVENNKRHSVTYSKHATSHGSDYVMKVIINMQSIVELNAKTNLGEGGHISIIDSDNSIVYSNANLNVYEKKEIQNLIIGSKELDIENRSMILTLDTISDTNLRAAVMINVNSLTGLREHFMSTVIAISIIILILGILFIFFISQKITSPLKKLEKVMESIEKEDYFVKEKVVLEDNVEVYQLSTRFNLMMNKIQDLLDKIVLEQQAQRTSELKALQNQINPHFLYNTLDSILWLIEENKNEDAAKMLLALAKLFRISISKGNNIIPIKDEIEHAKSYLLIQSIRYANSFKFEFDIDERVYEYKTMKLILQPLIENALYHGLKNRIDEGLIIVGAKKVENKIEFSVTDNGYGISQEKIEHIYETFRHPSINEGVGLKNIYQRCTIYYGKEADVVIESEIDEGTTIKIIIPIKEDK